MPGLIESDMITSENVVEQKVKLMARRFAGWMDREFGGRQGKDEPTVACIERGEPTECP